MNPSTGPIGPKASRWRLRFRLRTVLIAMSLLALPFAALGVVFERARQRARMVDALAQLGGRSATHWESFRFDANQAQLLDRVAGLAALSLGGCPLSSDARAAFARWSQLQVLSIGSPCDADLACFANCKELVALHISGGQLSPQGLECLSAFPRLEYLHLDQKVLSGEHLEQLRHAPSLRRLHLGYATSGSLDDARLLKTPALPNLEELELKWNRALRGPGLACVTRLPRLRWLNVDECPLEDEGLRHLEQAPHLGQIILDASRIGPEAVDRLMQAHPRMGFVDTSGTY